MMKTRPERAVADVETLRDGLRAAAEFAVAEADLAPAVGETGRLCLTVEVVIDGGRPMRVLRGAHFMRFLQVAT